MVSCDVVLGYGTYVVQPNVELSLNMVFEVVQSYSCQVVTFGPTFLRNGASSREF